MGNFINKSARDLSLEWEWKTYDSRPITSEIRWPSFRMGVLACPIELMKVTPTIHSSIVTSTSRANSWTWRMRAPRTKRFLGVQLGPIVPMTCLVKFGSNFSAISVVGMCWGRIWRKCGDAIYSKSLRIYCATMNWLEEGKEKRKEKERKIPTVNGLSLPTFNTLALSSSRRFRKGQLN
jgi:hypothetical protein